MKTAIITGATGFIGSWVTKELLNQGVKVWAVVRSRTKAESIFGTCHRELLIVECPLESVSRLSSLIHAPVDGIDVCYHFAWEGVSGNLQCDFDTQLGNVGNTLNLIDQLHALGVKRFIGAGSLHEREYITTVTSEERIIAAGNVYKVAKLSAHHMARVKCSTIGMDFLWPIITNTYGVGEKSLRLINSTIRKLLKGIEPAFTIAEQPYDFIYISDVAKAFYLLAIYGKECHRYTIGTGQVLQLKQYLSIVGEIVAPDINLGFGKLELNGVVLEEKEYNVCSLVKDTGFCPLVSFEEGIEKTLNWIKKTEKEFK